jgi:hypothetical protein
MTPTQLSVAVDVVRIVMFHDIQNNINIKQRGNCVFWCQRNRRLRPPYGGESLHSGRKPCSAGREPRRRPRVLNRGDNYCPVAQRQQMRAVRFGEIPKGESPAETGVESTPNTLSHFSVRGGVAQRLRKSVKSTRQSLRAVAQGPFTRISKCMRNRVPIKTEAEVSVIDEAGKRPATPREVFPRP